MNPGKISVKKQVEQLLGNALFKLGLVPAGIAAEVSEPDREFGDYSSNAAMALAKSLKQKPIEIAERIVAKIRELDAQTLFAEVSHAHGFINFRLSENFLLKNLELIGKEKADYGQTDTGAGEKVLLEYFQPNIAKPLHLGHLRTAIIGDALYHILSAAGYKVDTDTHVGDWGTQFGLLLYAYKQWGDDRLIKTDPINELNKLYTRINAEIESRPDWREAGKAEFVKLEQGDKENRKLWEKFAKWSWREFDKVYDLLSIRRADHNWGESFYEDKMPAVLAELRAKKLLQSSQGAQIVDLQSHGLGVAVIIKSDGGTTYLLRDLATYIYRKSRGFTRQIYVVDNRQKHTLAQTFKILELLGHIKKSDEAVHVDYGFMGTEEGAFSTRKGNIIGPRELLVRAQDEVIKIIEEKNPELAGKKAVAEIVAQGAVKYFDLSHNFKSDITFRWKDVLNLEGNTGPYLQYAYVRVRGINRKAAAHKFKIGKRGRLSDMALSAMDLRIMRKLAKFSETVEKAALEYAPHHLCKYLFELSQDFNAFYEVSPVIGEQDENKRSFRLELVAATAQVLKNGLNLLGIESLEEM